MDDRQAIARSIQGKWADAFAGKEWATLTALYTDRPAFYGSTPELQTSRTGVRSYFEALPPTLSAARYGDPEITPLGSDCFAASGEVIFVNRRTDGEVELAFRMTQIFVQEQGTWRIAVHHASPRPGPLLPA